MQFLNEWIIQNHNLQIRQLLKITSKMLKVIRVNK